MPRKEQGWITFQSSEEEKRILEHYCQDSQRSKTEILRELVRSLSESSSSPSPQTPSTRKATKSSTAKTDSTAKTEIEILAPNFPQKAVKISARNVLKGTIKRLVMGAINTEVSLEIAPGVEITSVITTPSAEQLKLRVKKNVYVVIKSNSVMIGEE